MTLGDGIDLEQMSGTVALCCVNSVVSVRELKCNSFPAQ